VFARQVAKPQTKAAENPRRALAPQRSTLARHRLGHDPGEQALLLQRTIGNQAASRLLQPQASRSAGGATDNDHEQEVAPENTIARAAPRDASRDFSKIPVFAPDRANRPQARLSPNLPPLPSVIQPKLAMGDVNDPLEHEADRVADQVMRIPDPGPSITGTPPQVSRKCAACEEEAKTLHAKRIAVPETAAGEAPAIVHEVLRAPGRPLDAATRAFFEPRFGVDFSQVRLHTDEHAMRSARAIGASAYTVGQAIVFGRGAFAPANQAGTRLLAHELTHVIQQAGNNAAGAQVGHQRNASFSGSQGMLQRQPNMPSAAPTLGGLSLSYDTGTGSLSMMMAGPQSTPVVSSPTIGLRHDADGSWHILVGGKDKVVPADEIPKLLRDATGQGGGGAKPAAQTYRVPTCNELRYPADKEQEPRYRSFQDFQTQRNLFHKGLPGSGASWIDLTRGLYDALVEVCIQESLPLPKPPSDTDQLQDLPGGNLPEGQAVA
jgi:Domain of unknown function (DUF4157)